MIRGYFEGERVGTGNAVPIVEKLPERMGTAFPLLKCLRTHKTHLKLRKKNKNRLRLLPYAKPRVVVQLTLTKIIKIFANRWWILWLKCTKFDFPRCGSLQRPRPPSCIWDLLLRKGKGGVEREGRGGRRAFPLFLLYETTADMI